MTETDYEAVEPRRFLPSAVGRSVTLAAEFEDLAAARRALRALREAGIGDEHVVLLGQLGDEVSTDWGLCADERVVAGAITWGVTLGAGVGALIGGALGFLTGLLALGIGSLLWAAVLAPAVFGAGAGGVIGGVAATRVVFSRAALHRHHPEFEHTLVGIHTDSPEVLARARTVLERLAPVRIEAPGGIPATAPA
ncbi:MAG: hypothetical protein C4290_09670 [Chloroflexota bacterium]